MDCFHHRGTETQGKCPFFLPSLALLGNFIARREEKQILLPQGGIRMTCHSEGKFETGNWQSREAGRVSNF
jgi:hypothetical protein